MCAFGFEQAHPRESRDAVVDMDHQLAGREVERELASQLLGPAAGRAGRARGAAEPAEELGVGHQTEPHCRIHGARGDVDVRVPQTRFELQVEVELDLPRMVMDTRLVEERPQPLGLLGGDGDRRRRCMRCELGCGFRPAHQRLRLLPTKVDRILATFACCELEMRMALEHPEPLDPDYRQRKSARKLVAFGFSGGEHLGLLYEHARVGQLAAGLEVHDRHPVVQVLEQRRHRCVQVGRVELDARESAARPESLDLLFPVRLDIGPQSVERHGLPQPVGRRGSASRPQQQLATRMDRNSRHRHHRALVGGVEQPEGLDDVTRPLGPHRRVGRGRKHVEDPAAQGELAVVLDQLFSRVAHLDQPARHGHGVGAAARREGKRAHGQVCGRDGRSDDRAARRNHDARRQTIGERVQGLQPLVDRLVERRRPVEEGNGHLREDVCGGPAPKPGSQLIAEAIGRRSQDEQRPAGFRGRARDRSGHDRPRRLRQPRNFELT